MRCYVSAVLMQECEMKCTIFNGTLVWETNTRNGVRISLLKQIRITSVVLTWDRRSSILLVPFSVVFLVVFLIDFLFVVLQRRRRPTSLPANAPRCTSTMARGAA